MYQVNSPRVVHETLDGETIIIDTQTGLYFTVAGHASVIWSALATGHSPKQIAKAYKETSLINPSVIDSYIAELVDMGLIIAVPANQNDPEFSLPLIAEFDVSSLQLKRHEDLQELIELDPIHEVDTELGWPIQSKDNN